MIDSSRASKGECWLFNRSVKGPARSINLPSTGSAAASSSRACVKSYLGTRRPPIIESQKYHNLREALESCAHTLHWIVVRRERIHKKFAGRKRKSSAKTFEPGPGWNKKSPRVCVKA